MSVTQPSIPGYILNEYLIVLTPNDDLRSRITAIRKSFNEKFSPAKPLTGKPHMALVRFVTWNMLEERIAGRLHHIAMGSAPFRIELKDFGSFPTHSIFINVATKIPVQNLVKEIKGLQKLMKADADHDPHFIQEPIIPVAGKLAPWQYEKGWQEYASKNFSAKMIADSMLLLKRPLGGKQYMIVQRFEFRNLPVAITQGELFL